MDVAWPGRKVGVFIDGCFWHRCPEHFKAPRTRTEWWQAKFDATCARDRRAVEHYEGLGWTVFRFWEHEDLTDAAGVVALKIG